jgi:hypothetical protein
MRHSRRQWNRLYGLLGSRGLDLLKLRRVRSRAGRRRCRCADAELKGQQRVTVEEARDDFERYHHEAEQKTRQQPRGEVELDLLQHCLPSACQRGGRILDLRRTKSSIVKDRNKPLLS